MLKIKLRATNESSGETLPDQIQIPYSATIFDVKTKIRANSQIPIEEQVSGLTQLHYLTATP